MGLKYFVLMLALGIFQTAVAQTDQHQVYGSFFGGSDFDALRTPGGIVSLENGGWAILMVTQSSDMWVSSDAYQDVMPGFSPHYIAKFDPDGTPVYGTYFGGSFSEPNLGGMAVYNGRLIVAGSTSSSDFPITSGAHNFEFSAETMGHVSCFSEDNDLLWSTFLGGIGTHQLSDCAVSTSGNVFVAGGGSSIPIGIPLAPGTSAPPEGTFAGYIAKYDIEGNPQWIRYVHSGVNAAGFRMVETSPDGERVYAFGSAPNEPDLLLNPHQEVHGGGQNNGFLACFSADDGALLWSTFYGGEGFDFQNDMSVSEADMVFISGTTNSDENFASPGAYQETRAGGNDWYLACFNPEGERLWGTYYGGPGQESIGSGISAGVDALIFSSLTNSETGIVQGEASEPEQSGTAGVLAKFDPESGNLVWSTYVGAAQECVLSSTNCLQLNSSRYLVAGAAFQNVQCPDNISPDAWQPEPHGDNDIWYGIFQEGSLGVSASVQFDLAVYPNPADHTVYVESTGGFFIRYALYDLLGKPVREGNLTGTRNEISVDRLPKGMYLLRVESAGGSAVKKLVVR